MTIQCIVLVPSVIQVPLCKHHGRNKSITAVSVCLYFLQYPSHIYICTHLCLEGTKFLRISDKIAKSQKKYCKIILNVYSVDNVGNVLSITIGNDQIY